MESVQHYKFVEGVAETLLKQFRLKFGRLSAKARQRVEGASAEQLDAWTGAVLTADSLDEVFASKVKRRAGS